MCLTIPKKVLEVKKNSTIVELPDGVKQTVKSIIRSKPGDYVLTQQNIIIQKIGKKEAKEIINLLNPAPIKN